MGFIRCLSVGLVLLFPFHLSHACEKQAHDETTSSSSSLPGGSIYNLDSVWINQTGARQSLASLAGRPRLVAMVFTRCQTACPLLVQSLKEINSPLPVHLFSFDSQRENVQSLREFMTKYRLDEKRWTVHTSTSSQVAELAAVLGVQYKRLASGDYIHSNIIFLVDANGEILAKKEGLNADSSTFNDAVARVRGQK
jgi:protein SCO1/2